MRKSEVLVFVRREDAYLVLRRSERQGGYWHSVAGGVEEGEDPGAAAARELLEETGLRAVPVSLDRSFAYLPEPWEPRFRVGQKAIEVACFLVDAPPGWEPILDWEHDEHRWCTRAAAVELLHWPEPREVLGSLA
jgi:dihydroneopterin triphosphate diphosphatase